jgi:hypothetical protein
VKLNSTFQGIKKLGILATTVVKNIFSQVFLIISIAIPSHLETALANSVVDRRKSIKNQFMEGLDDELDEESDDDEDDDDSSSFVNFHFLKKFSFL